MDELSRRLQKRLFVRLRVGLFFLRFFGVVGLAIVAQLVGFALHEAFKDKLFAKRLIRDFEAASLSHRVTHAPRENFPVFFALVRMLLQHVLVRSKRRHDVEATGVEAEGSNHEDDEMPEVDYIVARVDHAVLELHKTWLHCTHRREGSSLELDQGGVVGGRALSEEAKRLELLSLFLNLPLTFLDLLDHQLSLFRICTS